MSRVRGAVVARTLCIIVSARGLGFNPLRIQLKLFRASFWCLVTPYQSSGPALGHIFPLYFHFLLSRSSHDRPFRGHVRSHLVPGYVVGTQVVLTCRLLRHAISRHFWCYRGRRKAHSLFSVSSARVHQGWRIRTARHLSRISPRRQEQAGANDGRL
jgi:hypothetical protein